MLWLARRAIQLATRPCRWKMLLSISPHAFAMLERNLVTATSCSWDGAEAGASWGRIRRKRKHPASKKKQRLEQHPLPREEAKWRTRCAMGVRTGPVINFL